MTIWIAGCTSGLGAALAEGFIAKGHRVAGGARREEKIAALREKHGNGHHFQTLDVSSDAEAADFCQAAHAATGAPDLLINNAATINPPAPLWEIPAADFDRLTAVNLNGTANMIRHAVPLMMAAKKGLVINLSSGWGRSTSPEVAPYCASKWGIEGLTKALAQELPTGLGALALNPGVINTEMLQSAFGEAAKEHRTPAQWAGTAVPFILGLDAKNNGKSLTAP